MNAALKDTMLRCSRQLTSQIYLEKRKKEKRLRGTEAPREPSQTGSALILVRLEGFREAERDCKEKQRGLETSITLTWCVLPIVSASTRRALKL